MYVLQYNNISIKNKLKIGHTLLVKNYNNLQCY